MANSMTGRGEPSVSSSGPAGGLLGWFDRMPHQSTAVEISPGGVAAVRGARRRMTLEAHAFEPLPPGAVKPSPVEPNIADAATVRAAIGRVLQRVNGHGSDVAVVVPDQVVRVFLLQFDVFPRRAEEAIPLLRWRLKKSVPFDVEETVVSYMLQSAGPKGARPAGSTGPSVDVLAAVARQRIVRQYEELLETSGKSPGVVLSSTLAALPLVEDSRPALLARLTGHTLTTVIVRRGVLAVYRCSEMSADVETVAPQSLLDEIYPAAAYYQDTWGEAVQQVRLAGFAGRYEEFRGAVERELGCSVAALLASGALEERLAGDARTLVDRQFDALVGWMLHREA
jgi:type IV pilus assembly protein PilM